MPRPEIKVVNLCSVHGEPLLLRLVDQQAINTTPLPYITSVRKAAFFINIVIVFGLYQARFETLRPWMALDVFLRQGRQHSRPAWQPQAGQRATGIHYALLCGQGVVA